MAVSCNLAGCNRPESNLKLVSEVQAAQIDAKLAPLLGELVWHSLTVDATIEDASAVHYAAVERAMKQYLKGDFRETHILEVAAYAHITGYQLHKELEATVDLFDVSASTLRLGRRIAQENNLPLEGTSRTMGDFHELPYENDQFDVVYIWSALHHTLRWQQVLAELIRVLAPDGILFLGNEPIRRDFCFNTFRTNRIEFFTPFEKKLDELGIIRAVAEPYLGSRPETLFHMIENQRMPLGEILGNVASKCSILETLVQPEACMGPLEKEMLERRKNGDATSWLTSRLNELTDQARETFSETDRGLGFGLPTETEIHRMCGRTANVLASLPADEQSWEFRQRISELFGAPLQLVARKKGQRRRRGVGLLKKSYGETDGVVMALPQEILRLLDPAGFLLPDIQTGEPNSLEAAFPNLQWNLRMSPTKIRELIPAVASPAILIPVQTTGSLLVLLRMYVAFEGQSYRVMLCKGSAELASFAVFQGDSTLLSAVFDCTQETNVVELTVKTQSFQGSPIPVDSIRIHYAGAFMLRRSPEHDHGGLRRRFAKIMSLLK